MTCYAMPDDYAAIENLNGKLAMDWLKIIFNILIKSETHRNGSCDRKGQKSVRMVGHALYEEREE